jgi:hypothetical protein
MTGADITLVEYPPNASRAPACRYDGRAVVRLNREMGLSERFHGYAVPYRDFGLRRRLVVVFARDGKLFIDLGKGPVELLPQPASITGAVFWHWIQVHTSAGPASLDVFTAPHRHLTNDGMFPEDVEPILDLMRKMSDQHERQRYIRVFTTGSWEA